MSHVSVWSRLLASVNRVGAGSERVILALLSKTQGNLLALRIRSPIAGPVYADYHSQMSPTWNVYW